MRILINALSGIGDAIMFSPALALLKKHLPDAEIDMLVMFKQVEEIYKTNPNVKDIYYFDLMNQPKMKSLKEVLSLRKNKYDASINVYPSNRREYNGLQFLIGAKKKIAHRYNHYSRSNFDFLNSLLADEIKDRHNVLQNYDLIRFLAPKAKEEELGAFDLKITMDDEVFAPKSFIDNALNDRFVVGFHAGSATLKGHINKRWSADKYIELAKELYNKYRLQVMLFGTEKDVNEKIYNEIKSFGHLPKTKNIMQSLALMGKCRLMVTNDTALMHLSAALKVPTAAIFAYTNYKELYPWKNKHIIIRKELECSPCFFNSPKPVKCIYTGEEEFKCIKTISVEEVMAACEKLINESAADKKQWVKQV
jgi:heptosyltransferase II